MKAVKPITTLMVILSLVMIGITGYYISKDTDCTIPEEQRKIQSNATVGLWLSSLVTTLVLGIFAVALTQLPRDGQQNNTR